MPDVRDVSPVSAAGIGNAQISIFAEGYSPTEELEKLEFILQNVYSNMSKATATLSVGATTITIPTGTCMIAFCAISPTNTNGISFQQDVGSTAMPIIPNSLFLFCPASLTTFILTIATATTPVRFLFF